MPAFAGMAGYVIWSCGNKKGLGIAPQALLPKSEGLLSVRERRVIGVLDLLGHGLVRGGRGGVGNQRGGESESKYQCEGFHESNSLRNRNGMLRCNRN